MKRSSGVVAGVMGLTITLLTATLPAEEPTKRADAAKPQWQRYLQGEDAKKAAEQEKALIQMQEAGQFTEALKLAEVLTELRAKLQGADHWQSIDAHFQVEAIRRVLNAEKEEQQNYSRAFDLKRTADALSGEKRRYREAQPLYEQVLAIHRKVLGEEHPRTAKSYHNAAYNLYSESRYREAEAGFRKALDICRRTLGEQNPDTALNYNNVAVNIHYQGKHAEAEPFLRKALEIYLEVLGEQYPDTTGSLNRLAHNLGVQGKYAEAERLERKTLKICCQTLGEQHRDTATSYNNVASNLQDQGKYAEAEPLLRKAVTIWRHVLGEQHLETAHGYNNLAMNLDHQGKYAEAEALMRQTLEIFSRMKQPVDTARGYNNLAMTLQGQGKYAEAEPFLRKALEIRRFLSEHNPEMAQGYANMGQNLDHQGKHAEAEPLMRKALAIHRKELGEEHPDTATSYNNVASNLNAQGKLVDAETLVRKALEIRRKALGEEHPDTVGAYKNVAINLYDQGKYQEAETFLESATFSFAKARLHVAPTGLERATFISEHSPLPRLAAVLARNGKPDDAWQRFEESLARGTWDDLATRLRQPQAERDKQVQINARIDCLNKLIEKANEAKFTSEQIKQRKKLLSQLRQAYDELAACTQQLEQKYGPIVGQVFPRSQIQESLPADTAFVTWLDIAGKPQAADPNGEHWAILLRATGNPIWLRLHGSGEENAWTGADTKLPGQLRSALQSSHSDWQPLADRLRKQRLDPLAQHLKGVRRLIVLPSTASAGVPVEVIADGYTVSYTHSGTMHTHLLSQPAPTGKGLLVLADPVFDLPTEKEKTQPLPPAGVLLTMVSPGSNAASAGLRPNDVLLRYGDTDLNAPADLKLQPDSNDPKKFVPVIVWREGTTRKEPFYVRPGKLGVVIAQKTAPQAIAEQRRLDHLVSRSGDDGKWRRLPGTRAEAASLQHLFDKDTPVQLLLNSDASEQRLNELAQRAELGKYRYIHLATHGEVNDTFPLRSALILARDHLPDAKQRTELLLSGQPIPDGRLEAEEALRRWNLHCDLVTLSACQTALGKYELGEGFVGFAQSLILCGARSVCLSLWKVDDTATALLMERLYQNLLGKREGLTSPMAKAAALAEAKDWLRNLSRKEAIRYAAVLTEGIPRGKGAAKLPPLKVPSVVAKSNPDDHPFAHPYYWAAFVLFGQAD